MTAWASLNTAFNYGFELHIDEASSLRPSPQPRISWPVSPGLYLLESLMSRQSFEAEPQGHRGNAESRTAYDRQRLLSPLPYLTGSALKYRSVAQ